MPNRLRVFKITFLVFQIRDERGEPERHPEKEGAARSAVSRKPWVPEIGGRGAAKGFDSLHIKNI